MSVLTVRNLDDATRDALKAMAAAHGRSMEGEARVILTAAVSPTTANETGLGTRIAELFADLDWPGRRAHQRRGPSSAVRRMIVLDTNVVSELMRPAPTPHVREWVDRHPAGELWLTSMTVAELLAGVAVLPDGARKRQLGIRIGAALADLFSDRLLPFDEAAAVAYARVVADRRRAGAPIATADAVIAASCLAAEASLLATRNVTDFAGTGLRLANPWTAPPGS